jgi:hypothetical protein
MAWKLTAALGAMVKSPLVVLLKIQGTQKK